MSQLTWILTKQKLVPGLWKHNTRLIQFTLVVNDFSVIYISKEHAQHLKNTLEEHQHKNQRHHC